MSYSLRLVVNGQCNFACFFCYQEGTAYPAKQSLTWEQFVDLTADLADLRPLSKVRITGGEPLAYPALVPLLEGLRQRLPHLDLGITTNGSMPGRLAHVVEASGDEDLRVSISLPTLRPARFETITGSASLRLVLASIRWLVARGHAANLSINYVFLPGINDRDLADVAGLAAADGLRLKVIYPVVNDLNRGRVRGLGLDDLDDGLIEQRIRALGYVPAGPDDTYVCGRHRLEVVDCFSQQAIPYFRALRTLRLYYDGRVGVTGEGDGFIRPLNPANPRETLSAILHDVEAEVAAGDRAPEPPPEAEPEETEPVAVPM